MDQNISFTTPLWLSNTWTFNGFSTFFSFPFGMYLVWFKSTKEMTYYKHTQSAVVFYTSVFDIVMNFMFRPIVLFPLWGGFTDGEFPKLFGRALGAMGLLDGDPTYFLPFIQLLCYEAFVSLVCGFLFRFWALDRNSWFLQTVFRQYYISFIIHISTSVPCPIFCVLARSSRSSMITYIHEKHPQFSGVVNKTTWVVLDPGIGDGSRWASAYGYCCVFVVLLYMTVGTVTVRLITRCLNRTKNQMSSKTYKLHRSLLLSLCWQSVVPVTMYFFPLLTAALILAFQLNGNTQAWMNIFFAVMGTHSMINVLLMTYFTKPYRDFSIQILNRFGLFKKNEKKIDILQVSSARSRMFSVL